MDVAVGIVAQRDNERAQALAAALIERLEPTASVVVDEATGDGEAVDAPARPVARLDDRDLVVSIGGDGTLLFVAREVGTTPIVGVNLGEVGFLNAVAPGEAVAVVTDLVGDLRESNTGAETETKTGTGTLETRNLSRLEATPADADWTLEPALNELVVHGPRRGHGGGATVEIRVDGDCYAESHADGVLVATPTGSTAYNLSEGGPLVHPSADALVVTGMAPADGTAPLVVDPDTELTLTVSGADTAYVISDGRNRQRIDPPATVSVEVADEPVRLAGPHGNFVESLGKLE